MKLDRVTITGADDSVKLEDLVKLSVAYPFVEYGILVSKNHVGEPRWPSYEWLEALQRHPGVARGHVKLSLHVCGRWMRQLLLGTIEIPPNLLRGFKRLQINTHGEYLGCNGDRFVEALRELGDRQIIFQLDGGLGDQIFRMVEERPAGECLIDGAVLFDLSYGAGVLPGVWPKPLSFPVYHGYAGGLGPDNLAEQLPKIGEAAGDARFWLDMETRVRSDDRRTLDLAKVQRVLDIAEPFIK